jgi:hypothetical protein
MTARPESAPGNSSAHAPRILGDQQTANRLLIFDLSPATPRSLELSSALPASKAQKRADRRFSAVPSARGRLPPKPYMGSHDYRFFSGALVVLPRTVFAGVGGLDAFEDFAEFAATARVRRTPGRSPLVNSTPAASKVRCNASIVRSFNSSPRSNLATVSIDTFAAAASSRTPKPSAARAMRH